MERVPSRALCWAIECCLVGAISTFPRNDTISDGVTVENAVAETADAGGVTLTTGVPPPDGEVTDLMG